MTAKQAEIADEIIDIIGGASGPFTIRASEPLFLIGGTDSAITTAEIAAIWLTENDPGSRIIITDDHTHCRLCEISNDGVTGEDDDDEIKDGDDGRFDDGQFD